MLLMADFQSVEFFERSGILLFAGENVAKFSFVFFLRISNFRMLSSYALKFGLSSCLGDLLRYFAER